jgi:hypothetical protein
MGKIEWVFDFHYTNPRNINVIPGDDKNHRNMFVASQTAGALKTATNYLAESKNPRKTYKKTR